MSAQIGGGYNALVSKKAKSKKDSVQADGRSGDKRPAQNTSSQPAARREAKVLSLKESNAVQGKKDYKPPAPEEPKKEAPKKEQEPAPKKTTAEEKKEREKTDRHVPRSGKSPARGPKGEDSTEVVAAEQAAEASDDAAAAAAEKAAARLSKEEEEEKKKREEEERQITYEDYQKKRAEAAKDLPQVQARQLDTSKFAKFTEMKKDDGDAALSGFGKKATKVAPPPKPAAKAGKKGKVVEQPKAKSKPKKMDELLSFTVSDEPKGKGKGKGKGGGKGDGPRVPRGGPEWDQESKVDSDGVLRTKREFVAKYGGFAEWDRAGAQGADTAAETAPAADPEPEPESW